MKYYFTILFSFWLYTLSAQNDSLQFKKNAVYLEFLGSSPVFYNVGFDRITPLQPKLKLSTALGLQILNTSDIDGRTRSNMSASPQLSMLV